MRAVDFIKPLVDVEREAILTAMILTQGDMREAALRLGIEKRLLAKRLQLYRQQEIPPR